MAFLAGALTPPSSNGSAAASVAGGSATRYVDVDLNRRLETFRTFLRDERIVCELNPTSNHMLLGDSFVDSEARNVRSLPAFLRAQLHVVLCTDDDGVWAIHKCREHYRHVSVAHEFCQAIVKGDLKAGGVTQLVQSAHAAAFAFERGQR